VAERGEWGCVFEVKFSVEQTFAVSAECSEYNLDSSVTWSVSEYSLK
jgi:hypothetical protein